ncbi:S1C family serine protease [Halorussus sp. AFM4]|uniref:S1C family serine protease n=1 Tax=Halorussus sp. AFM4 TaxID=3421651 RepID=UPI003EBA84AD
MIRRTLVWLLVLVLTSAGALGGVTAETAPSNGTAANPSDAIAGTNRPAVSGGPTPVARQSTVDCNYTQLYDRASNGVVRINVTNESGDLTWGSGWVYRIEDSTAYVVTNWHVANAVPESGFEVQFGDGRWREAEPTGSDLWTDLAVLRVENVPDSARALEVANATPRRGQSVAAVGNPSTGEPALNISGVPLQNTITRGIVSGVDRAVRVWGYPNGSLTIPGTIQTDAGVGGGSSGGPLLNCRGKVLGVIYGGDVFRDVSFAVSNRMVRAIVPTLIANGSYEHAFLGANTTSVSATLAKVNDLPVTEGAMVESVTEGGPADGVLQPAPATHRATGLPYDGDVVLAVDGTDIEDSEDLLSYLLLEARPNETVSMTVLRDGENRTVEVTLGARPTVPAVNGTVGGPNATTTAPATTATTVANGTTTGGADGGAARGPPVARPRES